MSFSIGINRNKAECENITVTTGTGSKYNLGKPSSPLFKVRVIIYKLRRKI